MSVLELNSEKEKKWQEYWKRTEKQREIEAKLSREGYRGPTPSVRIELDGSVTKNFDPS